MSKKLLFLLTAVLAIFVAVPMTASAAGSIAIDEANFPDGNFRAYVSTNCDKNRDSALSTEEAQVVTSMDVSKKSITDLTGIEHFTSLAKLHCYENQLTGLDVSNNTALTYLDCHKNQLTGLDVSNNTALTDLNCGNNQLTELDVSRNNALTMFCCYGNQLTRLDVSNNTVLIKLECWQNQLIDLNMSGCTTLERLLCANNQLTELNVSTNIALTRLECGNNQLTELNVSTNTVLATLDFDNNRVTSLDISKNTALGYLDCQLNRLTELNVSKNTALMRMYCDCNQLTGLDVSKNTVLIDLDCGGNKLTELDISKNTALKRLYCEGNQLTKLDVNKNTAMEYLYCYDNLLTELDISKNTALLTLYCDQNRFVKFDLNKELNILDADKQTSNLEIRKSKNGWLANLAELVGRENLNKIILQKGQPWQYNPATGIAVCTDENMPEKLKYNYNGNHFSGKIMDVTLTLSENEGGQPGANTVVMKFGETKAYADGKIAPTTQYANGYATVKNIDGTAMLPLRYIAEVNGFDVVYDEESMKTMVISKATGEYLLLAPDSDVVEKYSAVGDFISSTKAPEAFSVDNDVIMGPQRFVCEALGLTVHYKWVADGEEYLSVTPEAITDEEFEALLETAKKLGL